VEGAELFLCMVISFYVVFDITGLCGRECHSSEKRVFPGIRIKEGATQDNPARDSLSVRGAFRS
jgi:hypothetical protein